MDTTPEPCMSDLSDLSGLSDILKNDDSIANRVRHLLEDNTSPVKPALLQDMNSESDLNDEKKVEIVEGSSDASSENKAKYSLTNNSSRESIVDNVSDNLTEDRLLEDNNDVRTEPNNMLQSSTGIVETGLKNQKDVTLPGNKTDSTINSMFLKSLQEGKYGDQVSNDDMLSMSSATEYQDLPEVSGGSLKLSKSGPKPDHDNAEKSASDGDGKLNQDVNSAESLAKIAGTVKYYLESDPNTPQINEEVEKLENLQKYMEGGNKVQANKDKETPFLLQQDLKDETPALLKDVPSSSAVHSFPLTSSTTDTTVPSFKGEAWLAKDGSINSDSDGGLTERIRQTLENVSLEDEEDESKKFNEEKTPSFNIDNSVTLNQKFSSLPTSPRVSVVDQSLESADSLANHVRGLLRSKSASPFSMLHHTDRKQLLSKSNQDTKSDFTGNLSQEIRNFENTDLWRFTKQFIPNKKSFTTPSTSSLREKEFAINSIGKSVTNNSHLDAVNLDESNMSNISNVSSILRKIRETQLPSADNSFKDSFRKSAAESVEHKSRIKYSPDRSSTKSFKALSPRRSSPSKIPVYSPYKRRNRSSYGSVHQTEKVPPRSPVLEKQKESRNPFSDQRLQPFREIFPEAIPKDSKEVSESLSFLTPLQAKLDDIDKMNTSSLLRYKVDVPDSEKQLEFKTPALASRSTHKSILKKDFNNDKFAKLNNFARKSDFKKPEARSKPESDPIGNLQFPRSSYLRTKIGLKPRVTQRSNEDNDSMQRLEAQICERTPAPDYQHHNISQQDYDFCTPKVSARPPQSHQQRIEQQETKPKMTILPTYDQLVVHKSLQEESAKASHFSKPSEPMHYSISGTSNSSTYVTQSTPVSSTTTTYAGNINNTRPISSITLFEDLPKSKKDVSDNELHRRTVSPFSSKTPKTDEVIAHDFSSRKPYESGSKKPVHDSANVLPLYYEKFKEENIQRNSVQDVESFSQDDSEADLQDSNFATYNDSKPDSTLALHDSQPALPYVRLKQPPKKKPVVTDSVSSSDDSIPFHPPPERSISTEKVQSLLLKEQNQQLQEKSNNRKKKLQKSPPNSLTSSSDENIRSSENETVLQKDLENLLNVFAEKAPIISDVLKKIYEQSLEKKKIHQEENGIQNKKKSYSSPCVKSVNKKKPKNKQTRSTQTTFTEEEETGSEPTINGEDVQESKEVACQTGATLQKKRKPQKFKKSFKEHMKVNNKENEPNQNEDVQYIPTKDNETSQVPKGKSQSFFIEIEQDKNAPSKREDKVETKPVAWFEPFQFEPPWRQEPNPKPKYGYVNANVQDAFLEHKREFVMRSWERQEDIQIRSEHRKIRELEDKIQEKFEEMQRENTKKKVVVREPHIAKPTASAPSRTRKPSKDLTFKELFERSRKAYLNLPEVKAKRQQQKRLEFYNENRIRADAYKKKVQKNVLQKQRASAS